jgi:hypothetical protein
MLRQGEPVMRAFAFSAACLVVGLSPTTSALAQGAAGASTLEDVRDQGVLYVKKQMFKQAKGSLDKAYGMPGGDKDFVTLYYRATACFNLLLVEEAFKMAEAARAVASDDKQKSRLEELNQEMSVLFGAVTLKAAEGETNAKGRIFFESRTGIINKAKKDRFMSIRERFRSTDITLPITVYLPWGDYLANKVPFELAEGAPKPELEIFLQVDRSGDPVAKSGTPWLWVGIGGAAAVAVGVAAFFLLQDADVSTPPDVDISIGSLRYR